MVAKQERQTLRPAREAATGVPSGTVPVNGHRVIRNGLSWVCQRCHTTAADLGSYKDGDPCRIKDDIA